MQRLSKQSRNASDVLVHHVQNGNHESVHLAPASQAASERQLSARSIYATSDIMFSQIVILASSLKLGMLKA
eukprot:3652726-Pleurochrysis_carterae.AAC.2